MRRLKKRGTAGLATWWLSLIVLSPVGSCWQSTDEQQEQQTGLTTRLPLSGRYVAIPGGYMIPYWQQLPHTDVRFEMVPVPGGDLVIVSADGEERRVRLEPFWIGRYEVTWDEFLEYMRIYVVFRHEADQLHRLRRTKPDRLEAVDDVDAVTAPTEIYDPMFRLEFATSDRQPASSMSQFGARQYTKWLSKVVPGNYRLPTEAEWTYASLAGEIGDRQNAIRTDRMHAMAVCVGDPAQTAAIEGPRDAGSRLPSRWGLYDMFGNVAEWVIDSGELGIDQRLKPGRYQLQETIGWSPRSRYGHFACGGAWLDGPLSCGPFARMRGTRELWNEDPSYPTSPWWMADVDGISRSIGFRLLRPLDDQNTKSFSRYWEPDSRELAEAVRMSLDEGRTVRMEARADQLKDLPRERTRVRPWEESVR